MKNINWRHIVLGIGIGFLLAAAVFLKMGGKEKAVLSDQEVIDRARGLGMIFLTESMEKEENGTQNSEQGASMHKEKKVDEKIQTKLKHEDSREKEGDNSSQELQVVTEEEQEILLPEFIEKKSYF